MIPNSSTKLARSYQSQEQTAPKKLVFDEKLGSQNHSTDTLGTLLGCRAPKVPIGFQPFAETTLQDSHEKPHSHAEEFYQFIGDILTYKYIRRPILLDQVYVLCTFNHIYLYIKLDSLRGVRSTSQKHITNSQVVTAVDVARQGMLVPTSGSDSDESREAKDWGH